MHPQVHPGPAHQDGIADPRRRQRPGQERHQGDHDCHGDGGVAGGKARPVCGLLAQHRVGHHLIRPGTVGNGLGHMRQRPGQAGGRGPGRYRQDTPVPGHDIDHGEHDHDHDAHRQEQMRQRRQHRRGGRRDLVENREQPVVPAERACLEQQRRNTEQRCSHARHQPSGPRPGNPGRPLGPPPRVKRDHGPDRQSGILRPPGWLIADVVRSPAGRHHPSQVTAFVAEWVPRMSSPGGYSIDRITPYRGMRQPLAR